MLGSMPGLESLDLYHTKITKTGYQALRTSLPQCRIFYDELSGVSPRRAGKI